MTDSTRVVGAIHPNSAPQPQTELARRRAVLADEIREALGVGWIVGVGAAPRELRDDRADPPPARQRHQHTNHHGGPMTTPTDPGSCIASGRSDEPPIGHHGVGDRRGRDCRRGRVGVIAVVTAMVEEVTIDRAIVVVVLVVFAVVVGLQVLAARHAGVPSATSTPRARRWCSAL